MNDKEQLILNLMNSLVIADTKTISDIVSAKGIWEAEKAYANCYKYLNNLADFGKIEKHQGFWRVKGCSSMYLPHAKSLSQSLAEILKAPFKSIIYREKTIQEIGLRPDGLILIIKENMGRCLILEVMNNETESYFLQKKNTWLNWEGATKFLSNLFGYVIPHFEILTSDDLKPFLEAL